MNNIQLANIGRPSPKPQKVLIHRGKRTDRAGSGAVDGRTYDRNGGE